MWNLVVKLTMQVSTLVEIIQSAARPITSPCGLTYWPVPLARSPEVAMDRSRSLVQALADFNHGAVLPAIPLGAPTIDMVEAFLNWSTAGKKAFCGAAEVQAHAEQHSTVANVDPIVEMVAAPTPSRGMPRCRSLPVRNVKHVEVEGWTRIGGKYNRWDDAQVTNKLADRVWSEEQRARMRTGAATDIQACRFPLQDWQLLH